ncbi:MAG: GGGtGRT protein [Clostridiales bacterium]|nr:GGGtGRT protein [Candidatus Apopatousia equi]
MKFESYEYKIDKINAFLKENNISSLEEAKEICLSHNINVEEFVKQIQPICFDNAVWAYTCGTAVALKSDKTSAKDLALEIGKGLQAFTTPGSVAETRAIGTGHGELASKLLDEKTQCFCFLAGHESFAAAEGAIAISKFANKSRKTPLKVVLNGLGKDAAYIIARINGFTFVETNYDHNTTRLDVVKEIKFSNDEKSDVKIYGAYDAMEGLAIMIHEQVDISITGNSTNPTRFQHPVAGTYRMWCNRNHKDYFSVASGGGTGRTLHPDNLGAGPASYGLTDLMGRMHADVQFAGSSSVPAHVDMMGFIGMGNNPMVGATVGLAVQCEKNK